MIELQTLIDIFQSYGYLAVFTMLLLCGFGLPVPEDITLVAGGVIAGLGYANPHLMFALSMVGVLVGDGIMFTMGRLFGERFLKTRWVSYLVTPERYAMVQQKFTKYGPWVIFFARFMPGLRSPIFVVAGVTRRVSYARFFLTDGFAALISVPIWVYLGYFSAANLDTLMNLIKRGQTATLGTVGLLILALVGYQFYKNRRDKRSIDKRISIGNSKPEVVDP